MENNGNNNVDKDVEYVDVNRDADLLWSIPYKPLRDFLLFDACTPFNVEEAINAKRENFLSWEEVLYTLRKTSQDMVIASYGTYPGLRRRLTPPPTHGILSLLGDTDGLSRW